MPELIVLLATIPWRRQSCERALRSLAQQTRVPDQVILHLDGFGPETPTPDIPSELEDLVVVKRYGRRRGVGNWWRSVEPRHRDSLIACIGDDFTYRPPYFERSIELRRSTGGCLCWHGRDAKNRMHNFRASPKSAVQIVRAGTACVLVPGRHLLGMCQHPLAPLFFNPQGHDEAFFSWWLSSKGVRITRAPGKPPLDHHAEGSDPRSTSIRFAARKQALRRLLFDLYGWPGGKERPNPGELAAVRASAQRLLPKPAAPSSKTTPPRAKTGLPHPMLARSTLKGR